MGDVQQAGNRKSAQTDVEGQFKLEGLSNGTWEVELTPRIAMPGGGYSYAGRIYDCV